ncbi:hypothetical protein yc1106_10011 [Curvularia clavata]|uniref:Uncharacterized protein n=1 Tax=Curvularia clavata TaxID=95742 RepID=A0A9Q8ZG24_CURCL|nr:hypothetical protein yc1106_10011 [Curvularia clavata]
MTANAPYYQMHPGQFMTTSNNANAAAPQFVAGDEEYDLADPAAVATPPDHRPLSPHLYPEHSARQTSVDHTLEENHNLVELLEAATAAGNAAKAMDMSDIDRTISASSQCRGKRKRSIGSPAVDASQQADDSIAARRRTHGSPTDPQLQGDVCNMRGSIASGSASPSSESRLNDARATGVHSAAALFRRASERTSRKYTRPPMSKVFMSLQLSPENFLQLQASAKAYMLDSAYPERQNCVGNRGKGDTDMVKLRLFNCVRDFLSNGIGEQFFGEHVEKPGEKDALEAARALGEAETPNPNQRLTWPKDGNKIIGLVTPLMRRMVTNERQRQYAIETRKGGSKKKDKEGSVDPVVQQGGSRDEHGLEHHLQTAFDPSLSHSCRYSQANLTSPVMGVTSEQCPSQEQLCLADLEQKTQHHGPAASALKLSRADTAEPHLSHINIFLLGPSSATTPCAKLDERRITAEPQAHLAWYDYNDFIREVISLLQGAVANHPHPEPSAIPIQQPGSNNLRGLAAAANALQTEHVPQVSIAMSRSTSGATASEVPLVEEVSPTSASAVPLHSTSDADKRLLSCCVIKSLGPEGWRQICNADDWYSVLREKAFAVWADGVCNVLVEMVGQIAVGS